MWLDLWLIGWSTCKWVDVLHILSFYKVEIIPYISENLGSDLPFSKCIQVNFLVLLLN